MPRRCHMFLSCLLLAVAFSAGGRPPDPMEEKTKALLAEWKPRFEAEGLNYVIGGPFVIAGDGSGARLRAYRDRTVLGAQRALRATYFKTEPTEPILILLFESEE